MSASEFQNLVEKYITGQTTPAEMEVLRQQLNDPEYMNELEKIMDVQLASESAIDQDYSRVAERLKKNIIQKINLDQHGSVRRITFLRRWMVAAALLIVIAGAGYFYFSKKSSAPIASRNNTSRQIDIAPGKEGAILTLDDHRTIVLDSLGNGIIADQHGTKVELRSGQLIYDKNGSGEAIVAYNTLATPKGRQFKLILPDGSKVWMNAASSLRYPTAFTGSERKVEVTGEVYFEVEKNAKMPFRVKINDGAEVEVLGTHFNINAYTNEATINTSLLEGSVKITRGDEKVVLKPGQQGQVQNNDSRSPIKVLQNVDMDKVMAWKNGVFNFEDATLEEVMRQLERWYDIEVVYEKGVPPLEFVGKMGRDLSLTDVLRGLEMSEVHFSIDGRKVIVKP